MVFTLDIFSKPKVVPIFAIDLLERWRGIYNIKPDEIITTYNWIFYLSNNINIEPNTPEGTYVVLSDDPETPYYFTIYYGGKNLDAYMILNSNSFYTNQH